MGVRAARLTATAVLPTPVGPTRTGVRCRVSGPTKPTFQFLFRKLHHARPAVDVVRRQRRRKKPHDQLAHLPGIQRLSRLDRRTTRVCRGKPLQAILPAAKPATGQIRDELLQAARGLEARVRVRGGMYDNAAPGERLDLVADARQQLPMGLDRITHDVWDAESK